MLHNFGGDFPLPLLYLHQLIVWKFPDSLCAQAYRSWMWRICHSLSLSHFRDFQTDLGVSAGWAAQRRFIFIIRWRSFTATLVRLQLASMTWFLLHQPLDFWQRLFFSGLWWNSLQLHDSSAIHIITGQKRHLSRWRNSIHTYIHTYHNLLLWLVLTHEDIGGSHLLQIHNLFNLHLALPLHFPRLCL